MKIKIKDTVMVNKGRDVGRTGRVERIFSARNKVVVSGVNIYKKHGRPTKKNPKGGIIDVTMPLRIENVALVCPHCSKPARVGYKINKDEKLRICKKCGGQV